MFACTFIESDETFKIWGQISVVLAFYVCYGKLFHLGSKSANLGLILSFVCFYMILSQDLALFLCELLYILYMAIYI